MTMRSPAHYGGGGRGRAAGAGASRRRRLTAALAAGVALAGGALYATAQARLSEPGGAPNAGAAKGSMASISDRRDTRGRLDLQRVTLRRIGTTRLEAALTMHDDRDGRDLSVRDGALGTVCLKLWTRHRPGSRSPDYLACLGSAAGDERGLVGRVLRERGKGLSTSRRRAGGRSR